MCWEAIRAQGGVVEGGVDGVFEASEEFGVRWVAQCGGQLLDCVGIRLRISSVLANSQYQALDAYTFWDYNESITPSGSYWIKREALETILTVWLLSLGFLGYHYFK